MPLQIRRGTELQRLAMTVPLASGELLYVTDDQRLYVGNGTTLGGVQITGYNNEDAIDAVGAALVAGVHSGISFTYGTTQDASNRIDATIDLSNYAGTLKADAIKGTIVADDSTVLVDAVSGRIVGPVFSNVVGNVTGDVTGNVTGNINGIITGTAGSTIIGDVTGNLTGYHFGDMTGSVFADDSTILVDAIDQTFRGSVTSNTGTILVDPTDDSLLKSLIKLGSFNADDIISFGSVQDKTVTAFYGTDSPDDVIGLYAAAPNNIISFYADQSFLGNSAVITANQDLIAFKFFGKTNSSSGSPERIGYGMLGQFLVGSAQGVTINSGDILVPGELTFLTYNDNSDVNNITGINLSQGVVSIEGAISNDNYVQFGSLTTAARNALTAANGMVIYNSTDNRFQGYQNGGWINLDDGTAA